MRHPGACAGAGPGGRPLCSLNLICMILRGWLLTRARCLACFEWLGAIFGNGRCLFLALKPCRRKLPRGRRGLKCMCREAIEPFCGQ